MKPTIKPLQLDVLGILLSLWGFSNSLYARSPAFYVKDSSFGSNGTVTLRGTDGFSHFSAGPDGKYLVLGYRADAKDRDRTQCLIMRLVPDGTPDLSFGDRGRVVLEVGGLNPSVSAAVTFSDGKILLLGSATDPKEKELDTLLVRLNSNGSLDKSFADRGWLRVDATGTSKSDYGSELLSLADGSFLVLSSAWSNETTIVRKFQSDGSADFSFGEFGKLVLAKKTLRGMKLTPDGSIVLSENHRSCSGGARDDCVTLRRINKRGELDSKFSVRLWSESKSSKLERPFLAAVDHQGRMAFVVLGYPATASSRVGRLTSDGKLDSSFGQEGFVRFPRFRVHSVLSDSNDSKWILGGLDHSKRSAPWPDNVDLGLARLDEHGALDSTFGENGFQSFEFTPKDESGFVSLSRGTAGSLLFWGIVKGASHFSQKVMKVIPGRALFSFED